LIKQITEKFKTIVQILLPLSTLSLFVDGPGEDVIHQCGRLYSTAYEDNQQHLFSKHLNKIDNRNGNGVTSFFVRKCVYKAFFGTKSLPSLKSAAAPQNYKTPNQDVIIDGQEVTTDGQDVTINDLKAPVGSQSPTKALKRGTESDLVQHFLVDPERTRIYAVATERPKNHP
jgi:Protein of unknown function (DUF3723)